MAQVEEHVPRGQRLRRRWHRPRRVGRLRLDRLGHRRHRQGERRRVNRRPLRQRTHRPLLRDVGTGGVRCRACRDGRARAAFDLVFREGYNLSQALAEARQKTWAPPAEKFLQFLEQPSRKGICQFRPGKGNDGD